MRNRISGGASLRGLQKSAVGIASLAAVLALGGCHLDRSAIVWSTNVEPPLVCPGDSVHLSYDTAEGGCLGEGCPPVVEVEVTAAGSGLAPVRMHGSTAGAEAGPITELTTFTFTTTGGRYGSARTPQSHAVDVILPEREHIQPITFAPECVGDAPVWYSVDLSSPRFRSESVRLVRVCNFRSGIVSLQLTFADLGAARRWTLRPGDCTEDFPPEMGSRIISANAQPVGGLTLPVECTTSSSGPLPGIEVQAVLACDLMTTSAPIVAASPVPTEELPVVPTLTSEPTLEPTKENPTATFRQNGNCRQGPSGQYDVVTSLSKGQQLLVEGRNGDSSWWYLRFPNSNTRCWASGSILTLAGPYANLPVIAALPTPTVLAAPAAPGKLVVSNQVCTDKEYSVKLAWTDVSGNDGYHIFRDGIQIGNAGGNATSYTDHPPYGGPYTYGVEAFNSTGPSTRPTVVDAGCIY
jgi:hypothetical protein